MISTDTIRSVKAKVLPPTGQSFDTYGDTKAIIATIMHAEKYGAKDTAAAAPLLKGKTNRETARNVWEFVSQSIRYKKDPPGHEKIKSPAQTTADGFGDCKSMSLLAGSLLKNLDIPHRYRYAVYRGDRDYTHVYLVAEIDGRDVVVDTTHYAFGAEVRPEFLCDLYSGQKSCPIPAVSGEGGSVSSKQWLGLAVIVALYFVLD